MRVRSELTAPLVALSAVLLFPGPASATIITFPDRITPPPLPSVRMTTGR
jgi:hypothetical protein